MRTAISNLPLRVLVLLLLCGAKHASGRKQRAQWKAKPRQSGSGSVIALTPRERIALDAVQAHVLSEHDGDILAAFSAADRDRDGNVGGQELQRLLEKVKLGDYWLRPSWSARVLSKLDFDEPLDGKLSVAELRRALPESLLPVEYKDSGPCLDNTCIARSVSRSYAD